MSRLTPAAKTASQAAVVRPVTMVRLDLPSGIVTAHSGVGSIAWGGDTYVGVGHLGGVGAVEESTGVRPHGMKLSLSGIPTELVSIDLGQDYQGRDARIYLALMNEHHQVVNDPCLVWRGRLDTMDIEMGETATISVSAESRLADWNRARVRRYNHEDQQTEYPGDRGLEFVPSMVERPIIWGRA